MTDPIADMLNQIRNAQAVLKPEVSIPYSGIKQEIANILVEEGFLSGTKQLPKKNNKILKIVLKYSQGIPAAAGLRRVSKPGQKIYAKCSDIKAVKGGTGIAIISTSKGLMTNKKARKEKLGGEVIAEIW
jgi:small subunit ribosomal protein S8